MKYVEGQPKGLSHRKFYAYYVSGKTVKSFIRIGIAAMIFTALIFFVSAAEGGSFIIFAAAYLAFAVGIFIRSRIAAVITLVANIAVAVYMVYVCKLYGFLLAVAGAVCAVIGVFRYWKLWKHYKECAVEEDR